MPDISDSAGTDYFEERASSGENLSASQQQEKPTTTVMQQVNRIEQKPTPYIIGAKKNHSELGSSSESYAGSNASMRS